MVERKNRKQLFVKKKYRMGSKTLKMFIGNYIIVYFVVTTNVDAI